MSVITKVLGRIQLRGANTSETISKNETLLDRELYIEKDVGIKIGDGIKQYNDLPYLAKFEEDSDSVIDGGNSLGEGFISNIDGGNAIGFN